MVWSGTPAAAAVVAAPIRKLWPEYLESSRPCLWSAALTSPTNRSRERTEPSWKQNKGPPIHAGRTVRNDSIAATGQMAWPVRPRKISTPLPKGSVLDWRRWILTKLGRYDGSRVTSLVAISAPDESLAERATNSPARRNPKNPTQHAAHSRWLSYVMGGVLQVACSMASIWGVTVRRWRGDRVVARERCRPFSMYDRCGNVDMSEGSGRPAEICIWWIAARYDLTDPGWSPASARWATNRQTFRSIKGRGSSLAALQKSKNLFLPET